MVLVYQKQVNGPATHVMVIGVGYYRHLLGGKGRLFPNHERLGQLTSPPYSARAFTDWLLSKFNNPVNPLSSVELLLSEKTSSRYKSPSSEMKKVGRATLATTKRAILRWKARGDTSKDNLMIFYFCGHGVSSGSITTLLCEDFGRSHDSPFETAIDFNRFYYGMDKCAARKQCFFVDACRVASHMLMQTYDYYGDRIITANRLIKPREAAILHSTGLGELAYSRSASASVFTEALLKALNGAGSNDLGGRWQVFTSWLHTGLAELMPVLYHDGVVQSCRATENCKLLIHQIEGNPMVPVVVNCDPRDATSSAKLSYSGPDGANEVRRSSPEPSDWIVEIEAGRYKFNAKFDPGQYTSNSKEVEVRPPVELVPIKV